MFFRSDMAALRNLLRTMTRFIFFTRQQVLGDRSVVVRRTEGLHQTRIKCDHIKLGSRANSDIKGQTQSVSDLGICLAQLAANVFVAPKSQKSMKWVAVAPYGLRIWENEVTDLRKLLIHFWNSGIQFLTIANTFFLHAVGRHTILKNPCIVMP